MKNSNSKQKKAASHQGAASTQAKDKLTAKQKAFCIHYVENGWNGTQAAISAGYSKETAQQMASENLLKPVVLAKIEQHRNNIEETLNISKIRVVCEQMKIAFASIAHLHKTWIERKAFDQLTEDQKACIAEISTKIVKKQGTEYNSETQEFDRVIYDVEYVTIKLHDKQKALDAISKLMGYDAPTKLKIETEIAGFDVTIRS